jgi:hypothetical protein
MAATDNKIDSSKALWYGIAFSFAFVFLIWASGAYWLDPGAFADPKPGIKMWYHWQLSEPTIWTKISAWLFYLGHQCSIWYLIWRAQTGKLRYTNSLHWENIAALGANAFFITLHLLQTHVWYDGLAGDTPEWTSQASVIVVLLAMLLMENQRRGLAFGVKAPFLKDAGRTVRKYHGYYFSWAIIYTFWYHPMDFTSGHLLGFVYMFLLLLQSSLFFTRMHVNPYWTIVQELSVVIHAVIVAIMNTEGWPRFLTGFLGLFVITQMHGLGLSRATRWVIGLAYIGLLAVVYSRPGTNHVIEAMMIPAFELVAVFILSFLVWIISRLVAPRTAEPVSI